MKAVVQTRYGSPSEVLELREIERPEPGRGEVLVRVRAASVHPDVWHVVTGRPFVLRAAWSGLLRPKYSIPGTDVAGVVEAVGLGVERFAPGDEVFGETFDELAWKYGGAFAEYVAVPEETLAQKPTGVSFEQAASVPTSGYIALSNLPELSWFSGRNVLVNGAGGGVGSMALQILKASGARVTAVDRAEKQDLLRALGADRAIDFAREDFTRGDDRYDFVFDVPGNHPYSACRSVLKPDGRYVLVGHEAFGAAGRHLLGIIPRFFGLMLRARFDRKLGSGRSAMPTKREAMATLRDLLARGELAPVVDRTFPLSEVPEALAYLASGQARGKILVTP